MTSIPGIVLGLTAGAALGTLYFQGLRLTVARVTEAKHPLLLILGSFAARTALAGVCFWLLARSSGWQAVVAGALGFLATRTVMVYRARHCLSADTRTGGTPR